METKRKNRIPGWKEKADRWISGLMEYDWLYVMTGMPVDILLYFIMILAGPWALWWFAFGWAKKGSRLLLITYGVMDAVFTLWWCNRALDKKELRDHPPEEEYEKSMDEIRQKLEEAFPSEDEEERNDG